MKERAVEMFKKIARPFIEQRRKELAQKAKMEANPGAHLDEKAREFLRNALTDIAGENGKQNKDIGFEEPLSWTSDEQKRKACVQVKKWLEGDYRSALGQEQIDAAMKRLEARLFGTN